MTPEQFAIVNAIRKAFDQLRFRFDGTYRAWVPWQEHSLEGGVAVWTKAIKTALCKVGHQSECVVACHGVNGADYGEFLWDVTWWKEDTESRVRLKQATGLMWSVDMPLVAECELTDKTVAGIVEDFQKLLVARAGVRLMIHEHFVERGEQMGEGHDRAPNMANHLAQYVQVFCRTQPDDVYLLAALQWDRNTDAEYRFRYFRLNTDGTAVEMGT